jgi:hypothetical protein
VQRNDIALKRRVLYDGEETKGLVNTGDLKDEKATAEAPGYNRTSDISSGVKKLDPLDLVYKVSAGTSTKKFFKDYYYNDEVKDVVIINTDATGQEIDRWLWPDTECVLFSEESYDAGAVKFFGVAIKLVCTGTPQPLDT